MNELDVDILYNFKTAYIKYINLFKKFIFLMYLFNAFKVSEIIFFVHNIYWLNCVSKYINKKMFLNSFHPCNSRTYI